VPVQAADMAEKLAAGVQHRYALHGQGSHGDHRRRDPRSGAPSSPSGAKNNYRPRRYRRAPPRRSCLPSGATGALDHSTISRPRPTVSIPPLRQALRGDRCRRCDRSRRLLPIDRQHRVVGEGARVEPFAEGARMAADVERLSEVRSTVRSRPVRVERRGSIPFRAGRRSHPTAPRSPSFIRKPVPTATCG
jgi:hypothetical protein